MFLMLGSLTSAGCAVAIKEGSSVSLEGVSGVAVDDKGGSVYVVVDGVLHQCDPGNGELTSCKVVKGVPTS